MTFKPLPLPPIRLPGTGNKKTAMGEVLDEARAGKVAGVDPTTVPQGGAQPYTDLAARHAASLREVGGNAGRLLRGDTSNIGGTMKGVVVDFLLGSLVGVPMEAVDQAGYDAAATGLSMVESAASGGATAPDARAWQFRNKGTPLEYLARGMGLVGTGAVGIATGGVGAGARLPAAVRALDILANGAASPLLAGAGKLVGKGRAARQAQAVAVDADRVKAALSEGKGREFDKLSEKMRALEGMNKQGDLVGGALQTSIEGTKIKLKRLDYTGFPDPNVASRQAELRTLETPALRFPKMLTKEEIAALDDAGRLDYLRQLRDSGGAIQGALPEMKVRPRNVAVDLPTEPDEAARQASAIAAGQLGFPGFIVDKGKTIRLVGQAGDAVPTQGRLGEPKAPSGQRVQKPTLGETLQPGPSGAARIDSGLTPTQVSLGERLTLLETLGDQQAVGRPLLKRITGTTRLADDGRLPNPEADAALVRLIGDYPTLTPAQLTGRVDDVRGLLGLAPEGTPTLGGYVARLEKLYGKREGGRRNAEANLAKMLGVKISPRTGAWSYNGADVTPLRDPFLDERAGLTGKAAKDAQAQAFRDRLQAGVDPDVPPLAAPLAEEAVPPLAAISPEIASLEESLVFAKEQVAKLKATGAGPNQLQGADALKMANGRVRQIGIKLSVARKALDNPGLVAPSARLLMQNPEVGTTALGAAGGALAGGAADPDGGVDGYLGGAIAGGAAGLGLGRAIDTPLSRILQLGLQDAKREFADAWTNGTISRKTVFTDVKRAMTATPRGLAIDWLGNLVRRVVAGVPRLLYKESGRNLEKNWSATKPGDVRKLRSDRVDGLLAKVGAKADEYDWATKYGQGYITAAAKGEGRLHPLAGAASGAGQALWNPATYLTGGLSVGLDAALGFGRSATGAVFKTANEWDQYATRDAAFINETEGLLNQVAVSFKATLKGLGIDASALPDDGQFLPAAADNIAPGLGQLWTGLVRQVVGTPAMRVGGQDVPAVDGLASEAVKAAFGDYATRQGWEKAIESVALFARYNLGQYKVLAKLATDNPAATMLLARWLQRDRTEAQATGRPGYQIGTVRVDTETPLIGRVVRAQLGGGAGEGRISPTATALGLQGSQLGAADKLDDAAGAGDLYALTEAVLGLAGFQPNPIIANLAYVLGGTGRAPGPLSRTAGLGAVFGGPKVPTVRGLLDSAREALGNKPNIYDPIDALAKEIIMEESKRPASDPANRAYMAQLLDPNSPLMQEARRRYEGGRAASNAVSLLSPITAQVNTDEKVAYRQAQADQAAQEVKTGAAATYKNPQYPQGAVVGGKKKDPRLFAWEQDNRLVSSLAPQAYAQMRFKFIRENNIKE